MRRLLLRSLLVALLIGPVVAFVSAVASVRTPVEYEPGVSQAEIKSYDSRTVSELEAFLKSRQVKLTRYQWLRESIGYSYFWKGIARSSVGPSSEYFSGASLSGRGSVDTVRRGIDLSEPILSVICMALDIILVIERPASAKWKFPDKT
jgi:hypothetical protein